MKLKSLLLGSAAVLALSTGAQAADPIPATFVSLGVCDAYGISGLTIESDDTCLSISGEVSYEYSHEELGAPGSYTITSDVDWSIAFEATSQTDAGAAIAFLELEGQSLAAGYPLAGAADTIGFDQAYVQFGDTTVLSAGKKDSIFDTEILDDTYGSDAHEIFDWGIDNSNGAGNPGATLNTVALDGHVIQIESLVADGFTVLVALEDLDDDGTAGLGVQYDNAGVSAEVGVLLGGLYGPTDPVNFYAKVGAEFDAVAVRAGVLFDDAGYWVASLGATATLDMFTLKADSWFEDNGDWGVAGEGSFGATDTIDVYLGAGYQDLVGTESFTVYGGVEADVTETIAATAELGYVDETPGGDYIYGAAGLTYAPGGGFETSLNVFADTDDHYKLTFEASKEF